MSTAFMHLPLLVTFALAAWAGPAAAAERVRIGVGLDKPPYIMDDGRRGLEIDIVNAALTAGGYEMAVEPYPPARAVAMMRAGHLDGMTTITEGIGVRGHFSADYITYHNVAITLQRRGIRLSGLGDLTPYSIAAFQNARLILTPEFAALAASHPDYREYPQQITQNRLLYTGRVDVVISDRAIFHALTSRVVEGIDTRQPVTVHRLFPPTARKIVFRDARVRDAFNVGLRKIHANGTYAAIEASYRVYLQR